MFSVSNSAQLLCSAFARPGARMLLQPRLAQQPTGPPTLLLLPRPPSPPPRQVPGRNAPLIAQKVGGRNIDHATLYVPWGDAGE